MTAALLPFTDFLRACFDETYCHVDRLLSESLDIMHWLTVMEVQLSRFWWIMLLWIETVIWESWYYALTDCQGSAVCPDITMSRLDCFNPLRLPFFSFCIAYRPRRGGWTTIAFVRI